MNTRFIFNQLCALLMVLSVVLLVLELSFFGLSYFGEREADLPARVGLIITGAAGLILGFFGWWGSRSEDRRLGRRDALLLVALTWLLGAGFAALPYFIWARASHHGESLHIFENFIDCYFEAMSGLTTTGASVLTDVESVPPSLLLWRAFTQWLGGLGIVVLFVAILPSLGVGGKILVRAEAGRSKEGVQPQIRDTVRILWLIYLALTVAATIAYVFAGMGWFDAIAHGFTTLSTAGFSTKNASVGHFNSWAVDMVVILFMILGAINFNLYYEIVRGRVREAFCDVELRFFLITLAGALLIVVGSIYFAGDPITVSTGAAVEPTIGNAARYGAFNAISRMSTTGFATADDNPWPAPAIIIMFGLMFIGGCAGSTAGGIKFIRIWIMGKILYAEIERVFRPHVIRPVKAGRMAVDPETRLNTLAFILMVGLVFIISSCGVLMIERAARRVPDITYMETASATVACFSTVGPGFGRVGATGNFAALTSASKLILSLVMVIGRVELFAIIVLLTPRFWRGD